MNTAKKIILSLWLALIIVAYAPATVLNAQENHVLNFFSNGYDKANQTSNIYDGTKQSTVAYGEASMPDAGDKERTMAGECSHFADFTKSVAADTADNLVTVTHFTSAEGATAIGPGGTLNAGSFVTTSNLSGLSQSEVETALEIDAGKGAYSTTFQTPASNLGPAFNGPLTSGGKPQFQLINPTQVTTFTPTP